MPESDSPSPILCPEHGRPLAAREVLEHRYQECGLCKFSVIARPVLNRLRDMALQLPDALWSPSASPSSAGAALRGSLPRRCPACQARLDAHTFGGGNVRVETCEPCDLVFLSRAELAALLKEARDGIQMSDQARAVLHHQRMLAAGDSYLAAELGLGTVVLVAVLAFLRIVLRVGFSTGIVVAAGIIAAGVGVHLYLKWSRQRAEAAAKMDRLAAAEVFRQEQKARQALSPAPPAPPADTDARPALAPAATSSMAKPRRCPVCRAQLPAGTTHCASCDSDFG